MTKQDFIFTQKFPQRLYRHAAFWLGFYIFSSLSYFHDGLEKIGFKKWILVEASETFFHITTQMLFCYAFIYWLLPKYLYKKKYIRFTIAAILLLLAIYWLYYLEHIYFFKAIHFNAGLPFRSPQVVYWFVLISLFTFLPISTGLALVIKFLKKFYIQQQANQLLTRENANAELQLLKAQIHPHFLFNTLNNIYSFTLCKSPEAPTLVSKLSDTIYYMVADCKTESVPLKKELKMLQDYIGLESVRYGDRLELSVEVNNECQDTSIAPLLMIPFVENCFKHGTSMAIGKQWIRLRISVKNEVLFFDLSNSKPRQPLLATHKNGIGLSNVKKRLALLYPGRHQLTTNATETDYSVAMQIQL